MMAACSSGEQTQGSGTVHVHSPKRLTGTLMEWSIVNVCLHFFSITVKISEKGHVSMMGTGTWDIYAGMSKVSGH